MVRMLGSYLLGFGAAWASLVLACLASWVVRHRRGMDRDWDLAFVGELQTDSDLAGRGSGTGGDAEHV